MNASTVKIVMISNILKIVTIVVKVGF